jgi:hypothetical protein
MILIIALLALTGWFFCSRWLFRYWVKHDTLVAPDASCSHGYGIMHKNEPCHGKHVVSRSSTAGFAMVASVFLPVILPFALLYAGITHNAPVSPAELNRQIEDLEEENDRLRRSQDRI